eukprot:1150527-Pelagomonas_calceolata.AAC.4
MQCAKWRRPVVAIKCKQPMLGMIGTWKVPAHISPPASAMRLLAALSRRSCERKACTAARVTPNCGHPPLAVCNCLRLPCLQARSSSFELWCHEGTT